MFNKETDDDDDVIETGVILKLGCGLLFAFYTNYGRIFTHFGHIQHQRMT